MRLIKFPPADSATENFEICFPGKSEEDCETLQELLKAPKSELRKLIQEFDRIIEHGLPSANKQKCRHLKGKVFELKVGPAKGPKIRVFGFRDGPRIVLADANHAKREDDPEKNIKKVENARRRYTNAKNRKTIVVTEMNR